MPANQQIAKQFSLTEEQFDERLEQIKQELRTEEPGTRQVESVVIPAGTLAEIPEDYRLVGVVDNNLIFFRATRSSDELESDAMQELYSQLVQEQAEAMKTMAVNAPVSFGEFGAN